MKKTFFILVVVFTTIISCDYCGDGCGGDDIHLSQKSATFKAQGDSIVIKTGGDWWWVVGIELQGDNYYKFRNSIDITSDFYAIEKDGYFVQKRDKHTLFIKLDENTTGKERNLSVELEAGDYFDYVNITQKAK